jgi:hypothetical protein
LTKFPLSGTVYHIPVDIWLRGFISSERGCNMSHNPIELTEGYTSQQAAEVLSRNSVRPVAPDYVRKLAKQGKIRAFKVNDRLSLYHKGDVDAYIVEERGKKAGRAMQARAKQKKRAA